MKNFSLAILLFSIFLYFPHQTIGQTYTVSIDVNDVWWSTHENFGADLTAVIYENGNPIPPSSNYYYTWWAYLSNIGEWRIPRYGEGFGLDNVFPETLPGFYIKAYVVVSDLVNYTFTDIQSEIVGPFSINGTSPGDRGVDVEFNTFQQNGSHLIGIVTPIHWRYTIPIPQWKTGYKGCSHLITMKG